MTSTRRLLPALLLVATAMLLASLPLAADNQDKDAAKARQAGSPAVTVFVDATWGNRTHGAARALTSLHLAWGRHGYQLVSVEPYAENGDLVGFFVSYRLTAASDGASS